MNETQVAEQIKKGIVRFEPAAVPAKKNGHPVPVMEAQRDPFPFVMAGDLIVNVKPISWLIHEMFENDSLTQLFGAPESLKSFAALDIACCVATGTPWHGKPVTRGAVFYLAGEGQHGIARRLKAWEIHTGNSLAAAPLFISRKPAMLYVAQSAIEVSLAVEQLAMETGVEPVLIVIDTLARNFGGDENSTEDMTGFINNIDQHLRSQFNATVMLIHHSGHADKNRARGSMALRGALDAEYKVEKDGTGNVTLEATKMKDAERPATMTFKPRIIDLPYVDDNGEALTSLALTLTESSAQTVRQIRLPRGGNQKVVYDVLGELLRQGKSFGEGGAPASRPVARLDALIEACRGRITVDNDRIPERVRLAVTGLINNGCIVMREGWLWIS